MDFSRGSFGRDALFGRDAFSIVVLATATSASIVDTTLYGNYITNANGIAVVITDSELNSMTGFISVTDTKTELNPVAIFSTIVDSETDTKTIIDAIHYRFINFAYSADIAPGETLCIDGEKFTVAVNGTNSIANFSGDFPKITPGDTVIYIMLTASNYSMQITKTDRKI